MIMDLFCYRFVNAFNGLQIRDSRPRHRAGGTEMQQQGALASGADAGNLV